MKSLKRFGAAIGFLGALVGLYAGAVELNWEPAFWIVFAGAVGYAIAPSLWSRLTDGIVALRNYQRVLERVNQLTDELEGTKRRESELEARREADFDSAVREGMARAVGGMLSSFLEELPSLICLSQDEGVLALIGRIPDGVEIHEKTRFDVVYEKTGDVKGAVEVDYIDTDAGQVYMTCVERTVPRFWEHLENRVDVDQTAPPGIVLAEYDPFRGLEDLRPASPVTGADQEDTYGR